MANPCSIDDRCAAMTFENYYYWSDELCDEAFSPLCVFRPAEAQEADDNSEESLRRGHCHRTTHCYFAAFSFISLQCLPKFRKQLSK